MIPYMNNKAYNPADYSLDDLLGNTILNVDSYKLAHYTFEEQGKTSAYGYIEARVGGDYTQVTFFGLQYFILFYLGKPITMQMIDEAEDQILQHGLPFNRAGWELLVTRHGGRLPFRIKALREGTVVPQGCVQATIECLDEDFAWMAIYVETCLLRAVWFTSTIAERTARWHDKLLPFLERTGTPEEINFKILDFGARGSESTESAGLAGMAVLTTSNVTDNQMGIRFARKAYGAGTDTATRVYCPAFSIPATEHSVTTEWEARGEYAFFENILNTYGSRPLNPDGSRVAVSVVIDTYDQDQAVAIWGTNSGQPLTLRYTVDGQEVTIEHQKGGLRRRLKDSNMRVVLRPDSGDPRTNLPHLLELAGQYFGFTVNDKGFKMLPDWVRLIQGDSVDEVSLVEICTAIERAGWSIDNLVFGSGGGLIQADVTRDSHRYAMKASEATVRGEVRAIGKAPMTDMSKASKRGRFCVVRRDGKLLTIASGARYDEEEDLLETIFEFGVPTRFQTFEDVRETNRLSRQRRIG